MAYRASILGASGYSGGELLRLLAAHPSISPVALAAGSWAGSEAEDALPHLIGGELPSFISLEDAVEVAADVCFSCLPSEKLAEVASAVRADAIVDLSDDFRGDPGWVYGLTEFARASLAGATRIANPGCYPTAVLLATLPFARRGLIEGPMIADAMSGVSGAGRKAEDRLLFGSVDGSVSAYGTVDHRHIPEMERGLAALGDRDLQVSFTPHLVPQSRGLLATVRAPVVDSLTDEEALAVLEEVYAAEKFVHVTPTWPATKSVVGSNAALVSARVDARNGFLIASCAIDNLGKGAAGQALQNANIVLGCDEGAGLSRFGMWP